MNTRDRDCIAFETMKIFPQMCARGEPNPPRVVLRVNSRVVIHKEFITRRQTFNQTFYLKVCVREFCVFVTRSPVIGFCTTYHCDGL